MSQHLNRKHKLKNSCAVTFPSFRQQKIHNTYKCWVIENQPSKIKGTELPERVSKILTAGKLTESVSDSTLATALNSKQHKATALGTDGVRLDP